MQAKAIELRNQAVRGADAVFMVGRQHRGRRKRGPSADPAESKNWACPGWTDIRNEGRHPQEDVHRWCKRCSNDDEGGHSHQPSRPRWWNSAGRVTERSLRWPGCAVKKLGGGPGATRGSNLPWPISEEILWPPASHSLTRLRRGSLSAVPPVGHPGAGTSGSCRSVCEAFRRGSPTEPAL
jgi:hypothetical protein